MGNKTRQIAKKAKPIQAKQSIEDVFRQVLWADLDRINEWVPVALEGQDAEARAIRNRHSTLPVDAIQFVAIAASIDRRD